MLLPCHGAFLAWVLLLLLLPEARGDCGHPGSVPDADPREELQESYPVGAKLIYSCRLGYEVPPGPRPFIECLTSSQWSTISRPCQRKRCPIPNIENGRIAGNSELLFGDQITFICDEGYRIVGHNGARCVVQDRRVVWDHDPPHCERIPCLPPPEIANGSHSGEDNYVYGSVVTYRCSERKFSLIGNSTITCISDSRQNGMWSGSAPECKVVNCRTPEVPNGVMITSYRESYTYGDRILFSCKSGFKLKGNRGDSSCGADSRWQPPLPECIDASTGEEDIPGGYTEAPELPTEESEQSCGDPGQPKNGRLIVPKDFLFGSSVNFTCDEGHRLIGHSSIQCVISGERVAWSGEIPICQGRTLLPSSGPNVTSVFDSQALSVTVPTYTSALPTLQTELSLEKLFIMLQEIKDIVNIKTKSLEEHLGEIEKKVDKIIYELKPCCQQAKERLEEEDEQ